MSLCVLCLKGGKMDKTYLFTKDELIKIYDALYVATNELCTNTYKDVQNKVQEYILDNYSDAIREAVKEGYIDVESDLCNMSSLSEEEILKEIEIRKTESIFDKHDAISLYDYITEDRMYALLGQANKWYKEICDKYENQIASTEVMTMLTFDLDELTNEIRRHLIKDFGIGTYNYNVRIEILQKRVKLTIINSTNLPVDNDILRTIGRNRSVINWFGLNRRR